MESPITDLLHPEFEFIQVVDALRLDKLSPSRYFFCKAGDADFKGIGEGVGGRPHKHLRGSIDVITSQEFTFVPHAPDGLDELHGINIEDVLPLRIVTKLLMISRETEYIKDIERGGSQNITLQGNSVPVPHHHLKHGFQSHQFEANAGSQTAKSGHRSLIVSDVNGIHMVLDHLGLFGNGLPIASPGWTAF